MKNQSSAIWLTILVLLASGWTVYAQDLAPVANKLLAAMPIAEQGMTHIAFSANLADLQLSLSRAVSSHVLVRGSANIIGSLDLVVRLLAPLEFPPVFLAVELGWEQVTGLITLFFGPIIIDLGRTWITPSRWALIQIVTHPCLTIVIGGSQHSGKIEPQVGWRLFPTGSAQWEVGMMFGRDGISLSLGWLL